MTVFESTPLAGGATLIRPVISQFRGISIHAPRGRGDSNDLRIFRRGEDFNPRPSREGRQFFGTTPMMPYVFQSTPLAGGATKRLIKTKKLLYHFNPRPSREGRHLLTFKDPTPNKFQSTPLAGGATFLACKLAHAALNFNPRPSREGRPCPMVFRTISSHFNPRPSREGRRRWRNRRRSSREISIHAPRGRGDIRCGEQ